MEAAGVFSALVSSREYSPMATNTNKHPPTNSFEITKPKSHAETIVDVTMDTAVAKLFRMLSAYLMTMATTSPPPASKAITSTTRGE